MIKIVGSSDVGKVRVKNEDSYAYAVLGERTAFGLVCDGMGGENGGNVASLIAVQQIEQILHRDLNDHFKASSIKSLMTNSISVANAEIYHQAITDSTLSGMGTTIVLCIWKDDILYTAHAGDSRAYECDENSIAQLTLDHSVVQLLINRGEISRTEAKNHPERHYITKALGISKTIDIEYNEFMTQKTILLCSDGVYNCIAEDLLKDLVQQAVQKENADVLIEAANHAGGQDNITAVILYKQ